jgi:hypothetical protein
MIVTLKPDELEAELAFVEPKAIFFLRLLFWVSYFVLHQLVEAFLMKAYRATTSAGVKDKWSFAQTDPTLLHLPW